VARSHISTRPPLADATARSPSTAIFVCRRFGWKFARCYNCQATAAPSVNRGCVYPPRPSRPGKTSARESPARRARIRRSQWSSVPRRVPQARDAGPPRVMGTSLLCSSAARSHRCGARKPGGASRATVTIRRKAELALFRAAFRRRALPQTPCRNERRCSSRPRGGTPETSRPSATGRARPLASRCRHGGDQAREAQPCVSGRRRLFKKALAPLSVATRTASELTQASRTCVKQGISTHHLGVPVPLPAGEARREALRTYTVPYRARHSGLTSGAQTHPPGPRSRRPRRSR
jgi:hypothetical protein